MVSILSVTQVNPVGAEGWPRPHRLHFQAPASCCKLGVKLMARRLGVTVAKASSAGCEADGSSSGRYGRKASSAGAASDRGSSHVFQLGIAGHATPSRLQFCMQIGANGRRGQMQRLRRRGQLQAGLLAAIQGYAETALARVIEAIALDEPSSIPA
ncbi:unnamed protein product [Peronospora destructor]|uniref:Uncharacterized protein n=1 Tax=Peronospora destructor TaxID=86335 RepID=A0AAV0V5C8_9STRA|nr:unnamed protein product [Peronospora destructor]